MTCDQVLAKFSEKFNSPLLVKEQHGFQKGAYCAHLAKGAPKKPGLDMVKVAWVHLFYSNLEQKPRNSGRLAT